MWGGGSIEEGGRRGEGGKGDGGGKRIIVFTLRSSVSDL